MQIAKRILIQVGLASCNYQFSTKEAEDLFQDVMDHCPMISNAIRFEGHIAISKQIVPTPIITEQEAANLKHVVQGQVSGFYKSCRSQFVTSVLPTYFMFLFYAPPRPEVLWETYNVELCDDLITNVQNWENDAIFLICRSFALLQQHQANLI